MNLEQDENPPSSLTGWDEFPGTLPRAKKVSTGHFFTSPLARPPSSSPITHPIKNDRHKPVIFYGVGDGTRTHNAWNHNPVLCQLNYTHHILFC